jgi:hypothetical protein
LAPVLKDASSTPLNHDQKMKRNQPTDTPATLTPLYYFWIKSNPGLLGNMFKDKLPQQGQKRKTATSLANVPTPRFFDYTQ